MIDSFKFDSAEKGRLTVCSLKKSLSHLDSKKRVKRLKKWAPVLDGEKILGQKWVSLPDGPS